MRRFLASGLPIVLVIAVFAAIGWVTRPRVAASPASAPGLADESPCVPIVDKWVHPQRVLLGETVDITLTVRALCPGERSPEHIVLVVDASGWMSGQTTQDVKDAASGFVRGLDMDQNPATKVGVVEFNSEARTLSQLTNKENRAIGAINRIGANGGTRIDAGILEGIEVLRQGRGGEKDITEVMVVLSGSGSNDGCNPVLQAARQARGQGILMIAIGVGPGCDEQCARQVASSPRWYFSAESPEGLHGVFQQIRDRIFFDVRELKVTDTLSEFVRYVPDSAEPEPSAPWNPSQWLQWDDVYVPMGDVTYTLTVRPLVPGYIPTNEEARGVLRDNKGRSKEWTFPVPWITVLEPNTLPTPDRTATPTREPPTTATPSPSATPEPNREGSLYLPIAFRDFPTR